MEGLGASGIPLLPISTLPPVSVITIVHLYKNGNEK